MNNLILVRHGQSFWNKERRFTGWADIDLTEKGKLEAQHAGQLIKKLNINIDAYFTSNLKRAINTLKIIFVRAYLQKRAIMILNQVLMMCQFITWKRLMISIIYTFFLVCH